MWDLSRSGLEPVSPALAGRFSTTAPPGKPSPPFSDLEISTPSLSWSVGGEQRHSETRVGVNVRDPKMKVAFRTEWGEPLSAFYSPRETV